MLVLHRFANSITDVWHDEQVPSTTLNILHVLNATSYSDLMILIMNMMGESVSGNSSFIFLFRSLNDADLHMQCPQTVTITILLDLQSSV